MDEIFACATAAAIFAYLIHRYNNLPEHSCPFVQQNCTEDHLCEDCHYDRSP